MTLTFTYNYCGVCGHQPQTDHDEMNQLRRWWDCDDGWKIGAICRYCWEDCQDDRPKPEHFAYDAARHDICTGEPNTDEDPLLAL